MNQRQLNQEIAAATGESLGTIAGMGFVPLTRAPFEQDREPLVVDWDELELRRDLLHPR